MHNWNPDLYLRFENERTQPAADLAARIELDHPGRIVDLGCGPGNSTQVLRRRWPAARIEGLDSSPEMIAKARAAYPRETWIQADIPEWRTSERFDVVFSCATLQWIADHRALLPRLFDRVADRGALAVQVPANNDSPLHLSLLSTAGRPEWSKATAGCAELVHYHDACFYYDILAPLAGRLLLWETTYVHILPDHDSLIEWYSGTGMRTYLQRLPDDSARKEFSRQVLDGCRAEYLPQADGVVLFPFRRLFFIAYRE